jgi:hypothetical protein
MKQIIPALIILSASLIAFADAPHGVVGGRVVYSEETPLDTENGNYIVRNLILSNRIIAPVSPRYRLLREGNRYILIERGVVNRQAGVTPYPNPPIRMNEQNCGNVNLSARMGPVREQIGLTCYANAAVELLSFGQTEVYSPMYLAGLAPDGHADDPPSDVLTRVRGFNNGHTHEAMRIALERGLCPEQYVRSDHALDPDYARILSFYEQAKVAERALDAHCDREMPRTPQIADATAREVERRRIRARDRGNFNLWVTALGAEEIGRIWPSLNQARVDEIFTRSVSSGDFIRNMNAEACNGRTRIVPAGRGPRNIHRLHNFNRSSTGQVYVYEDDRARLLDNINNSLVSQRPIAIAFYTNGLIQQEQDEHAKHAAVVAGRRWSNGKCVYLVKNSWGPSWTPPAGMKATRSSPPGHFEMTEQQLLEHTYETTHID